MKTAVLECADTGPFESAAVMLRAAGYRVFRPHPDTLDEMRRAGCDCVIDPATLVKDWGYPAYSADPLPPSDLDAGRADLFVTLKAQRTYERIVGRWPALAGRVLWYRINGGEPEHVVNARGDHGDEVRPSCPVLTPNQWYGMGASGPGAAGRWRGVPPETLEKSYACWPPFVRAGEYAAPRGEPPGGWEPPVCFVHNLAGWGYGPLEPVTRRLGVRTFGVGSPGGLVPNAAVPGLLRRALCVVHLKSSDAPGYALYEALAAGCPVVCTRKLIWKCTMGALLEPGATCLAFDRETHDPFTPADLDECARELETHLAALRDPAVNAGVGAAGRGRLAGIMWSAESPADVESFRGFLARHFP